MPVALPEAAVQAGAQDGPRAARANHDRLDLGRAGGRHLAEVVIAVIQATAEDRGQPIAAQRRQRAEAEAAVSRV